METKRGKLIVLDGGDGSGKTEQTDRLLKRMLAENHPAQTISFPRYHMPTGKAVKAYLDGVLGPTEQVPAKQASLLYATDRLDAVQRSEFAPLEAGVHMIANRYAASNMGHQGSKIVDAAARTEFFLWNDALEHARYGIPRPDLNIILHVPAAIAVTLIDARGNPKDGHENLEHLKRAEATYLELASAFPGFVLIECVDARGALLEHGAIHEKVWSVVRPLLSV